MGQTLTVTGTMNGSAIHASEILLDDNQTLTLRSESGQPMWSGGVQNSNGATQGSNNGEHTPEPQAQVDEWITIEGKLESFQRGSMVMKKSDGTLVNFQTGQPRFFEEQNITFQPGDQIIVTGFYENEQVMAGDITQVATGLRVMLRDPNGRPLWAGPGSGQGSNGNGNGNGKGNGGGHGNGNNA